MLAPLAMALPVIKLVSMKEFALVFDLSVVSEVVRSMPLLVVIKVVVLFMAGRAH